MGYHLSSVYGISPGDAHEYFVFYIGDDFQDVVSQWIDKNFTGIAREIGPNAVIVHGISEKFNLELLNKYKNQIDTIIINQKPDEDRKLENSMIDLFRTYHEKYQHGFYLRFFLITDKNPHLRSGKSDRDIFFLVPLDQIKEEAEIREIIQTIVMCVRSNNFDSLEDLVQRKFTTAPVNLLKALNQSLELKPNVMGLGINLNGVINLITNKTPRPTLGSRKNC